MKITIEIDTDKMSLEGGAAEREVACILEDLADDWKDEMGVTDQELSDFENNLVGHAKVEE